MTSPSPYDYEAMSKDEVVEVLMKELWQFLKGSSPHEQKQIHSHGYDVFCGARDYLPKKEPRHIPIRLEELVGLPVEEVRRKYGHRASDCLVDVEGRYENEDINVGKAFGDE